MPRMLKAGPERAERHVVREKSDDQDRRIIIGSEHAHYFAQQ